MNEQQRPVAVTIDRSSARDLMVTALIVWAAFLALRWLFDVTHVFLFEVVLAWEEPWRGVYGHLLDRDPHPAMELGFLARKPGGDDAV